MNKNPLISVIVPIYNVEKYLSKCIDSIIGQTYSNLEIILVDDGSPDNCGKICDEYAERDNRIVVVHKDNGGVGSARNMGTNISTGDFITYVDGDDYLSENYVEKLYDLLKDNDIPISICNMYIDSNGDISIRYPYNFNGIYKSDCIIGNILNFKMAASVYCKLYRKSCLNIRFSRYVIAEDLLFLVEVLSQVNNVVVCNDCLYFYSMNPISITKSDFKYEKYESLEVYNKILDMSECTNYYSKAKARLVRGNFHILLQIPKEKYKDEYKCICSTIKKYRKSVMLDNSICIKTRLACALSYLGFNFVRNVFYGIKKLCKW